MRLFIAICLPDEIKRQLSEYARAIGDLAVRAHVTREDNFHLTLAFLGEALGEQDACAALDKISAAPFKLYSDKPGSFLRGNSAIFWLGLKNSPELTALHTQLRQHLRESGFAGDNRPFAPHLTLARETRGLGLEALPPPPRFIIPVDAVTLMESTRRDGNLVYLPRYKILLDR